MNDTRLILFTRIYSKHLEENNEYDKLQLIKSNINFFSLAYSEWLFKNENMIGYDNIIKSMEDFISNIF